MEALEKVKCRNNLLITSEYAKLVALLCEKVKTQFASLNLNDLKADPLNLILFICDLLEFSIQERIVPKKVSKKLNKNELVLDIIKCLFPSLTETEIKQYENMLQFAIDCKLIKKSPVFVLH
jgi:hypothetical protein